MAILVCKKAVLAYLNSGVSQRLTLFLDYEHLLRHIYAFLCFVTFPGIHISNHIFALPLPVISNFQIARRIGVVIEVLQTIFNK